jgi:hypothetical protein
MLLRLFLFVLLRFTIQRPHVTQLNKVSLYSDPHYFEKSISSSPKISIEPLNTIDIEFWFKKDQQSNPSTENLFTFLWYYEIEQKFKLNTNFANSSLSTSDSFEINYQNETEFDFFSWSRVYIRLAFEATDGSLSVVISIVLNKIELTEYTLKQSFYESTTDYQLILGFCSELPFKSSYCSRYCLSFCFLLTN